ncbi:MAG: nucleoside deaminase [Candidatus Polarisedimenticolaceae bacterium]|nr:nucleoside deaminase [Candidatus Polarisedimenticolaceae bacterium]
MGLESAKMDHAETLMRLAISEAEKGIAAGQSPFGCTISLNGEVIAVAHNRVVADTDATAHAEINAIRAACQKIGDIHLSNAIVATTCEPCPMCMSALHWARVKQVYYGATIADAEGAGFNELTLSASTLLQQGGSNVELIHGPLQEACQALFRHWTSNSNRHCY